MFLNHANIFSIILFLFFFSSSIIFYPFSPSFLGCLLFWITVFTRSVNYLVTLLPSYHKCVLETWRHAESLQVHFLMLITFASLLCSRFRKKLEDLITNIVIRDVFYVFSLSIVSSTSIICNHCYFLIWAITVPLILKDLRSTHIFS